jgi:alpha-mannosidase
LDVYSIEDTKRPPFKDATSDPSKFRQAKVGDSFGPSWTTHWFRVAVKVPSEWKNAPSVIFTWDCGNEGMIFTEDGGAVIGLSGEERREWLLPLDWIKDGKWHTFYIETSCNGMFGNADPHDNIQPPDSDRYFELNRADLVLPNEDARALRLDFTVIADCANNLPDNSWQKEKALEVASAIMDAFDESDPSSVKKCREIATRFLGSNVNSSKVFEDSSQPVLITGLGHCHIDTAWLWPYAETRRKIGRSWASQLDLVERYPEYNFVCSQAVQYQWLKEDYPELFERVKKAVKAGRFIPVGGSWVESDTNMPSGEAIVRQFLYGQRFFEENFGTRCKTFWLPDTFGYSAQLPQLCRGAGLERFLTQKLSWNNINKFPNTTFNWVALDGTQVLCHMPPADTYNSNCSVPELNLAVTNNKNRGITETSLLLFGYGDGGGGPTDDMLEKMRRNRGVSDTVGELPRVKMNGNVDQFFDQLVTKTNGGKDLVSWVGELYFEFHRGTYTSQARTKHNNRACEGLLHDAEYVATLASIKNPNYNYPKKELDQMWQMVLLNQFHDVLPGSSIEMVYDDVEQIYSNVTKQGAEVMIGALVAAGVEVDRSWASPNVVALNTLPWGRSEVVRVPKISASCAVSSQSTKDGHLVHFVSTAAGLIHPVPISHGSPTVSVKEVKKGVFVLENSKLRATFIGGLLTSLVDLTEEREIMVEGGRGNQFVVFDDQPLNWQAWDTEVYSLNKFKNVAEGTVTIVEKGPLRAAILIEQQISARSWIKTTVSLDAYSDPGAGGAAVSYLEYNSEVEWREACKFLKVEFPVDVHSDFATYDSMYGSVRRPTHYNTSWDVAKFEVCCHKYADFSDHTYGVSVLNDSKYGFAIHGNVMRLSMLRAPKAPDANCDMGRHYIRYAILGHKGAVNADVVRAAQNFNHPLTPFSMSASEKPSKLCDVRFEGPGNVVLSAVKRGEDDADVSTGGLPVRSKSQSVIVRLYDSLGGKSKGTIVSDLPIKKVYRTNLLEDDDKDGVDFTVKDGQTRISITLRAFEVASFRLEC